MMQRICFFSGDVTRNGGTERVSITIANELAKEKKYHICFLSLVEQKDAPCYDIAPNIQRFSLGNKWLKPGPAYLPLIPKVKKFLTEQKIDVLIDIDVVLDVLSVPAAKGLKTKVISWEHSNLPYELGILYRRVIVKHFTKKTDKIVTLTKGDAEAFRAFFGQKDRVTNIYNPATEIQLTGKEKRENWLITASRLVPEKGFEYLLQVAKEVLTKCPDWKWVLCGEGPERKNIESFCKAEGLEGRILLMGYVPKVETFLLKSKIFVLTSKAEGLPMCLLEARSCGVPCVSFDVPTGPADLIDDGVNGYLIEPFDVKAMAEKLESLMRDEELLSGMAKKAPKGMEEFQLSGIVLQWKDLIDQLLE